MGWLDKLKDRWKVGSVLQVVIILVVFACTGTTVLLLKRPIFNSVFDGDVPVWASVVYYILILPVYNLFLLFYGFVFGQFQFFWNFEKRMINRMMGNSKKDN